MNLARAGNIPSSSISWDLLRGCCIYKRTLRIWTPRPTCGRILAYAKQQVVGLREHLGLSLCIFKIGVTANLPLRFQDYFNKNYSQMWVLLISDDLSLVHMLEAALISEFHCLRGCKNAPNTGGEGALNRKDSGGPPFYVYVVGGRADQAKWVG